MSAHERPSWGRLPVRWPRLIPGDRCSGERRPEPVPPGPPPAGPQQALVVTCDEPAVEVTMTNRGQTTALCAHHRDLYVERGEVARNARKYRAVRCLPGIGVHSSPHRGCTLR